jgi:hypothetical protein
MLLFLHTRRFIPDLQTTPDFSTPRSAPSKGSTQVLFGVTPFAFPPPEVEQQPAMVTVASEKRASVSWSDGTETLYSGTSVGFPTSITSDQSTGPLNHPKAVL